MQDEGHRNAQGDILRYAGRNVHDSNGALHPILRGGRQKPPYFLSVSMMADKESSKETSVQSAMPFTKKQVLIYDNIIFLLVNSKEFQILVFSPYLHLFLVK